MGQLQQSSERGIVGRRESQLFDHKQPAIFRQQADDRRFAVLDRFPFAVPYQIKREEIVILALAHTSRRPGYWSRRR